MTKLRRIDDCRWEVPREGAMRVPGLIFADDHLIADIREDQSVQQVANVATLPGIVGKSLAMPDIHWGYGFPIGGVAAFDAHEGVISPGGVGYDINCGVRLLRTKLHRADIQDHLRPLVDALYDAIPTGVGSHRKELRLAHGDLNRVLTQGARWAVEHGYGSETDIEHIEERGCIADAEPEFVSARAFERGSNQLGTLGSGNHFCEVGYVSEIYDAQVAQVLGLEPNGVTIIIHTGSRGLGYQTCDDYLAMMLKASAKYGIELPDKQLCAAPLQSPEGQQYLGAMAAAANFAFANRQMIRHFVEESFLRVLKRGPHDVGISTVYDVCHNIAKWETHVIDGKARRVCVHRKGATRAFPPGHEGVSPLYRAVGQPVIIPGDMGRYSYVLVGTAGAYEETFGSCCHGAGRVMSRTAAKKSVRGRSIVRELEARGIYVRATGRATVDEESSEAYKDVADVVDVVHKAGIGKKVARLDPLAVIKG